MGQKSCIASPSPALWHLRRASTGEYRKQNWPSRIQLRSKYLELVQNLNYNVLAVSTDAEDHSGETDECGASVTHRRPGPPASCALANERACIHRGPGATVQTVRTRPTEEIAE